MSDEEEFLKPCPCCNSKNVALEKTPPSSSISANTETTGWYVECYNCGLRTAAWLSPVKARKKWERRAGR